MLTHPSTCFSSTTRQEFVSISWRKRLCGSRKSLLVANDVKLPSPKKKKIEHSFDYLAIHNFGREKKFSGKLLASIGHISTFTTPIISSGKISSSLAIWTIWRHSIYRETSYWVKVIPSHATANFGFWSDLQWVTMEKGRKGKWYLIWNFANLSFLLSIQSCVFEVGCLVLGGRTTMDSCLPH